ncbi:biliverdin-producing heme oxygenase [Streptomyces turgidiscabies]|uniref:Heme oxygenase n=1 Tax=Streptomyces turgidiscabies (strain Car8) TaxID=698760 RepID=L7FB14_STRT8|nr:MULTISPECIES: biliverdin-producing heme oxygenase [Streptomyces]ELP68236.1 heme oxygenase [Streptomyces turgidiscabies Car8]MDX3496086.1 biliverdin-producing heme oxygenase [Streptomyces turgidiscabies]GAQ72423.1 heme oxygenase [Streptomyces turgidiscabies]
MTAAPVTMVERLRTSTRDRHDALEATPFASAMLAGTLPVECYVGQLAAYRLVLGSLEGELSRLTGVAAAEPVWSADLVKLPLVDRDLAYFANLGTAPGSWAAEEAEAFTAEIRQRAAESDLRALLGFLYVMEGSTLGALYLYPYVTAAYRLPARDGGTDGVAYYSSGDRERWARFTARMNQAFTDPDAQDQVVAAARVAYRHTAAITGALSVGLSPPSPAPSPTPAR